MGFLEVDRLAEQLWLHHYGKADMQAWQANYGLPWEKYRVMSGSVSVEQTDDGLMIAAEVYDWPYQVSDKGELITHIMYGPYVYPIPEGIGKLVDWDWKIPKKEINLPEDFSYVCDET